jgi:hypothetical protein
MGEMLLETYRLILHKEEIKTVSKTKTTTE